MTLSKCKRCNGTTIKEKYYGREEHWEGWRCIPCGDIIDEVVEENRRWSYENERSNQPAPPFCLFNSQ